MITHDKYLVNVEEEVELFLDIIEPLLNKMLALLIQLPPSMEIMSGREGLEISYLWITGSDLQSG
ncbi:MAG: hypothetical protein WAM27_08510 [Nitrososphaeraceae archaeon]|jgi:uncharacterized protein YecE (DUF72 family)